MRYINIEADVIGPEGGSIIRQAVGPVMSDAAVPVWAADFRDLIGGLNQRLTAAGLSIRARLSFGTEPLEAEPRPETANIIVAELERTLHQERSEFADLS